MRRYGTGAALLTDSGTSALRLAIASLAPPGEVRVALPAWGCYDLATAALGANAQVSFYDLDPRTLGPDWASFDAALAQGVHGVVVVHQFGYPVDLDAVRQRCQSRSIVFIEDAAQGNGGTWRSKRLGALGDLGVLSFGRGKGMTAGGGGALLASGARAPERLDAIRHALGRGGRGLGGWFKLLLQAILSNPILYGLPARLPFLGLGDTPFHEPWLPRRAASSQQGVIATAVHLADQETPVRLANGAELEVLLRGIPGVGLVESRSGQGTATGWLRFPILLDPSLHSRISDPELRRLGVMRSYPRTLPQLPPFQAVATGTYPGADRLAESLVTIPTHRWVLPGDRAAIAKRLAG